MSYRRHIQQLGAQIPLNIPSKNGPITIPDNRRQALGKLYNEVINRLYKKL